MPHTSGGPFGNTWPTAARMSGIASSRSLPQTLRIGWRPLRYRGVSDEAPGYSSDDSVDSGSDPPSPGAATRGADGLTNTSTGVPNRNTAQLGHDGGASTTRGEVATTANSIGGGQTTSSLSKIGGSAVSKSSS